MLSHSLHSRFKSLVIILLSSCMAAACAGSSQLKHANYLGDGDCTPSPTVRELISEHATVSPGGHAYLYLKKGDGHEKVPKKSVADIHLRILDIDDSVVTEDSMTVTLSEATPLLQDVLPQMVRGDRIRVWGDSYMRVWEIELDDFRPIPKGAGQNAAEAMNKLVADNSFENQRIRSNHNERIKKDQFIHIHKTITKKLENGEEQYIISYDQIVQVNKHVVFDYYYDLFTKMAVGERARVIRKQKSGYPDLIVDIWILDRYTQYETPEQLSPPSDKQYHLALGIYKQMLRHNVSAQKLSHSDWFKLNMNCWNSSNGELVTTTDVNYHGRHSIIEHDIISRAQLRHWRGLVGFEQTKSKSWSICDIDSNHSGFSTSKLTPWEESQCRQQKEDEKGREEYRLWTMENKGAMYDLSFAWKSIMRDASYGDVFMIWLDHNAIDQRDTDYHPFRSASEPEQYSPKIDLTCRVRIDKNN